VAGDLGVGTVLAGKYEITGKLGAGGMGTVYAGRHLGLGRPVAIKTLLPELLGSADMLGRFQQEARAASAIGNPHIVNVFDLARTGDGTLYQVMELLEGEPLSDLLERSAPLPIATAVAITDQVLGALIAAHKLGIVHRDLKPDNIFLCRTDDELPFVKLLDFGVSKVLRPLTLTPDQTDIVTRTQIGSVVGTPLYMAPEQAGGVPDIDPRADLWAVGAVLYEMLTGTTPFSGNTYHAVIFALIDGDVPLPSSRRSDLPGTLEAVVMGALTKNRDLRYSDAASMRAALRAAAYEPTRREVSKLERADTATEHPYANLGDGHLVAIDGTPDAGPEPVEPASPAAFHPPPVAEAALELAFDPRAQPARPPEPAASSSWMWLVGLALAAAALAAYLLF